MNIEITARHFTPSSDLKTFINEKVEKLLRYDPQINSIKVVLLKESNSFVLTLLKDRPIEENGLRRINVRRILDLNEMINKSNGKKTIPQIFFDNLHIGGYVEIRELEKNNKLLESLK